MYARTTRRGRTALLTLATLTAMATAPAALAVDANRMTAGDLLELCATDESAPTYAAAMGFCFGYVDAVLDYHAALTAGEKFTALTCPPAEVTRETVSVAVVEWSVNNEHTADAPPVHVVMQALEAKWPCSE